jgi:hypothetical protein
MQRHPVITNSLLDERIRNYQQATDEKFALLASEISKTNRGVELAIKELREENKAEHHKSSPWTVLGGIIGTAGACFFVMQYVVAATVTPLSTKVDYWSGEADRAYQLAYQNRTDVEEQKVLIEHNGDKVAELNHLMQLYANASSKFFPDICPSK